MAKKKGIFGSIVNYIWNKSMAGKKESLINSYDNDPGVASAISDMEKGNKRLRATLERIHKKHNLKTKI